MKNGLTIDAGFLTGLMSAAVAAGVSRSAILRHAGISPDLLDMPRARVSQQQLARLLSFLTRATRDEMWLNLSRPIRPGTFRMMCRLLVRCPTLQDAIRVGCHFYHLVTDDFTVRMTSSNRDAMIWIQDHDMPVAQRPLVHGTVLQFLYGLMCWLVGSHVPLNRVDNSFSDEGFGEELRGLYKVPLFFDQPRSGLVLPKAVLSLPILPDDTRLDSFMRSLPSALLVRYHDETSVAERVKGILRRNLASRLSIEHVASMLAMSEQTLRRRLLAETGDGFRAIKDAVRIERATYLLGQPHLSIDDVAYTSGFSEVSAFHRAFRRWTGFTPGEYRRGQEAGGELAMLQPLAPRQITQ